jgi:hypothetical protein
MRTEYEDVDLIQLARNVELCVLLIEIIGP